MAVEYVPLLRKQWEIYQVPRGAERFREYLSQMVSESGDELALFPLAAMNPMGKEHCVRVLEQYLAMNADSIAQEELSALPQTAVALRFSLVLVDDAQGGWTSRTDYEYKARVGTAAQLRRYPWISAMLWTGEAPSEKRVRETVRLALFRASFALERSDPTALSEILEREGRIQRAARVPPEPLSDEEIRYTREVLAPHLEKSDMPTVVAALFGDEGAASLGYPPLGLEKDAGLRLAWHSR